LRHSNQTNILETLSIILGLRINISRKD